jgi:hypothetical protein
MPTAQELLSDPNKPLHDHGELQLLSIVLGEARGEPSETHKGLGTRDYQLGLVSWVVGQNPQGGDSQAVPILQFPDFPRFSSQISTVSACLSGRCCSLGTASYLADSQGLPRYLVYSALIMASATPF